MLLLLLHKLLLLINCKILTPSLFLQMVELSPGSHVFLYEKHITQAMGKQTPNSCASFLLNCFLTNSEMQGMNLSGANGKRHPDKDVVESIIGKQNNLTSAIVYYKAKYTQYYYLLKWGCLTYTQITCFILQPSPLKDSRDHVHQQHLKSPLGIKWRQIIAGQEKSSKTADSDKLTY